MNALSCSTMELIVLLQIQPLKGWFSRCCKEDEPALMYPSVIDCKGPKAQGVFFVASLVGDGKKMTSKWNGR